MSVIELQTSDNSNEFETVIAAGKPVVNSKISKTDILLKLLKRKKGVSVEDMMAAVGWQTHSVRGFISGVVRKKLGLTIVVTKADYGSRRYSTMSEV